MNSKSNNKYLTLSQLIRYVEKKLSSEELNHVENILDNNPICNEALEGILLYVEQEGIDEAEIERLLEEIGTQSGLIKSNLIHHPDEQKGVYTLNELLDMFNTVEHYEPLLAEFTERSGAVAFAADASVSQYQDDLLVISPQTGEDCSDSICFILNRETQEELLLIIENNQEESLIETSFPADTDIHQISITHFRPGRYYWKLLLNDEDFIMGSFFVRKDLMPKNL